ncbi:MAG: ferrous iron transport protein A [Bacilli bacterium]|nr:ferrous iron transport protein A [Bacilli bacterium]
MKLNDLKLYEEGIINKVTASEDIKRRFLDIGINRGVKIKPILSNKTMRAYLIKGTVIGIRLNDSKNIEVII